MLAIAGERVNAAELARRGARLARSGKYAPAAQLLPVGPPPAAELLLVGALLWPRTDSDPDVVLALVLDDDIADPALCEVLKVARSMVYGREPVGLVVVHDELRRTGRLTKLVYERLTAVATSGGLPEALRGYACATVAASLRRRVESAGNALTEAAETMHEDDLAPMAQRAAAAIASCAARLDKLRGGEG